MTTKRVPHVTPKLSDHASNGEDEEIVAHGSWKMSRRRGDGSGIQSDRWSFEANYEVRGSSPAQSGAGDALALSVDTPRAPSPHPTLAELRTHILSTFSAGQLCTTLVLETLIALLLMQLRQGEGHLNAPVPPPPAQRGKCGKTTASVRGKLTRAKTRAVRTATT